MICIKKKRNALNKKSDIDNLNTSYFKLINKMKDIT